MKKNLRIIKRVLSLLLVFLLSINSFAAIVSDNDGSSFVTKAEFDTLKNNFAKQINEYNSSIDGKIDGAIASYLAGIKIAKMSTKDFFDGKGSKVLVCNIANVNDITRGQGKINFNLLCSNFNRAQKWEHSVIMITMTRDNKKNFEMFMVDNGKVRYMKEVKLTFNSTAASVIYGGGRSDSVPAATNRRLRWHASPWASNKQSDKPKYNRKKEAQDWTYWSDRLDDHNFYSFYGTAWNFGWVCDDATSCYGGVTANVAYDVVGEEVGLIFDNSRTNGKIWVNGPTIAASDAIAQLDAINNLDHYNNTTTTSPAFQVKYNTPTAAGITTTAKGRNKQYSAAVGGWPLKEFSSVAWVDYGDFSHENNTGLDDPTQTTAYWYELAPALYEYSPKNLKQNVDADIISQYASYGYTGNLVQGVPIGVFDKDCEIQFKFDTTSLGSNAAFALSKTPFDPNTTNIENSPAIDNTVITVDGIELPTGYKLVSSGVHNVSVKMMASNSNKIPLFFKVSWASTYTGTTRKTFNLPTEYTYITND